MRQNGAKMATIKITHHIGYYELLSAVMLLLANYEKNITRGKVTNYLRQYIATNGEEGIHYALDDQDLEEEADIILRKLFPEIY